LKVFSGDEEVSYVNVTLKDWSECNVRINTSTCTLVNAYAYYQVYIICGWYINKKYD